MAVTVRSKSTTQPPKKLSLVSTKRLPLRKQLGLQLICLGIAFTVIFPIIWVLSVSLTPLGAPRPQGILPNLNTLSLESYSKVFSEPTQNKITEVDGTRRPITFFELAFNSFKLSAGVSIVSVLFGVSSAYAFSRFKFPGRALLMLGILAVLMLPAIGQLGPLYTFLNQFQWGDGKSVFNLRNSLWGVGLALSSSMLPFAIWNMKGYLDTIPKDLEEAASIDGANRNQIFARIIMPLATPSLAVTALFGFFHGWTEFGTSWQFLNQPKDFTLAMALAGMTGQYARTTPWSQFSAFAILVAIPVMIVYLFLQRYIVGGLTAGAVKS